MEKNKATKVIKSPYLMIEQKDNNYIITGLTEEGKKQTEIEIPDGINKISNSVFCNYQTNSLSSLNENSDFFTLFKDSMEVIKGRICEVITHNNKNFTYNIIKICIPNKIKNTETQKKQPAFVEVDTYIPEIKEKFKTLKYNDLIAIKGKWHFRINDHKSLILGINAIELQVLKPTKENENIQNEQNDK